jgi:hypothetical protein
MSMDNRLGMATSLFNFPIFLYQPLKIIERNVFKVITNFLLSFFVFAHLFLINIVPIIVPFFKLKPVGSYFLVICYFNWMNMEQGALVRPAVSCKRQAKEKGNETREGLHIRWHPAMEGERIHAGITPSRYGCGEGFSYAEEGS